jgi:hypothetical protein
LRTRLKRENYGNKTEGEEAGKRKSWTEAKRKKGREKKCSLFSGMLLHSDDGGSKHL